MRADRDKVVAGAFHRWYTSIPRQQGPTLGDVELYLAANVNTDAYPTDPAVILVLARRLFEAWDAVTYG